MTGYIASNWPDIAVRTNAGGVPLGYNNEPRVSVEDAIYFSPSWTQENISQRGPLGALYRVWGDGRPDQSGGLFDPLDFFGPEGLSADELRAMGYIVWTTVREPGAFTGEGDTGTFLNLIDNGLRGFELDTYGGWGGYRSLAPVMMFPPARGGAASEPDANSAMMAGLFATGPRAPNAHPFLAAAQRDFAARLRWATTPSFADANHEPTISVAGERVRRVRSERPVRLAVTTSDPDGDRVAVRWWQWLEAGSVVAPVEIDGDGETATVTVSGDALSGQTVHIIAEATDADGLVRYARIVLIVR